MGSFSSFYIGEYEAFCSKNSYAESIVNALFCENDFVLEYDEEDTPTKVEFRCTAQICKDRLEIYGVNKESVRENFNEVAKYINENKDEYPYYNFNNVTFDEYLNIITEIVLNNIKDSEYDKYDGFKRYLIEYNGHFSDGYSNCGLTENNWLYVLLYCIDPQTDIYYDLTSIASGGWIPCESRQLLHTDKIIVLTEGKTDTEFIIAGLELYYPHLLPFYQFVDYDEIKLQGSASFLAQIAKALVGVESKNKTILLFDNDAVGHKESNTLSAMKLPDNIKVLHYPDIDILKSYPVVSIDGNKSFNVNGLAGSIEMYLGVDTLKNDDNYFPIYLSEYIPGINRYQGSLSKSDKNTVQCRFREKLKKTKSQEATQAQDWNGIKKILNAIMHAWD